ncbi:MAG: hypothetical protein ACI8QZ_004191 [Chlamydiales bacterium]|jgi:hypothetical protein
MKKQLRTALITLTLASLSTACRNNSTATAPEAIDAQIEESSFRLFPAAGTSSSGDGGGVDTRSAALGEPIASHPRQKTTFVPRPSVRTQLRQATLAGFNIIEEESLRAVITAMRNMTGLPLVVHPRAEDAVLDAGIVFDLDNEIGAVALLNLIENAADDEIKWVIRHDAILFTVEADARAPVVVHAHDIRGITSPRTDFAGPRIDGLRLLGDADEDEAFGGSEQVATITEEEVLTMVQENIAPQTWEQDGISIDAQNGLLIVVHSLEVQLKVPRFLESIG